MSFASVEDLCRKYSHVISEKLSVVKSGSLIIAARHTLRFVSHA